MPRTALLVFLLLGLGGPAHAEEGGALGVYLRGPDRMVPGTTAAIRLGTHLATAPETSRAVDGVALEVALVAGGRREIVWRGTSARGGTAEARFVVPSWPAGAAAVVVVGRLGQKQREAEQTFELTATSRLLLSSDKPLYQPGQTIHLRGLGLRSQDGRPLAGGEVTFELYDAKDNRLYRSDARLSAYGVATVDFALASELTLGDYEARLVRGEEHTTLALRVERYALPRIDAKVTPDRSYYRAGERARLTIDARYFFGKPVAGGAVTLRLEQQGAAVARLKGRTDADGRVVLDADLPRQLGEELVTLELRGEIVDAAGFRQRIARSLTVAREALVVEVVPEAGTLRPGLGQRIWVVAARPDGTPAANAEVIVSLQGGKPLTARTDALGVAEVETVPPPPVGSRGCVESSVTVALAGERRQSQRCLAVTREPILVRTDRAIHDTTTPLAVEVSARGASSVWVDVIKDDQVIDGASVTLTAGRGRVSFPIAAHLGGTLVVHARAVGEDGRPGPSDSRLVYVAPPSSLRVTLSPGTYRPGERASLRLRVVDGKSGEAVRASVGIAIVDRAVLSLRAERAGSTRVLLTLGERAARAGDRLTARPGGLALADLVETLELDAARQRAAAILLAGSAPARTGFESDPWGDRETAWSEQETRLAQATEAWVTQNLAAERVDGAWMWRRDLVARMVETRALAAADARDPWDRPISAEIAVERAGLPAFDEWAEADLGRKLSAIYRSMRGAGELSRAALEARVRAGKLARHVLRDAWGTELDVVAAPRTRSLLGVRSARVVASAGPDQRFGTADDLYPYYLEGATRCGLPPLDAATRDSAFGRLHGAVGCAYGYGSGIGGGGVGGGRVFGSVGTGRGQGGETPIRRDFPETMLWLEAETDARGEAVVAAAMADSITTWRLSADAIAADGRLGAASTDLRVFQDFFVDVDLPSALTQGDELSVPIAVHNYLPTAQRVELRVEPAAWFTLTGPAAQTLELPPSSVRPAHVRIKASALGAQRLLVRANGTRASDAVERETYVHPDGVEQSVGFQASLAPSTTRHALDIPAQAIAGTQSAQLKIFPTTATHALEGLDAILKMPSGCFEQTSSTTYPNLLVLDYLRRSPRADRAVQKRAEEYVKLGYQRLLSFEVKGGGFSWFGSAPANQVLTAYGVEEFFDMKRVFPVDPKVIDRTQRWLVSRQDKDGGWRLDAEDIADGVTNGLAGDRLRITAYIGRILARTGGDPAAVERARGFVRRGLARDAITDPYTLALAVELLGPRDRMTRDLVARLWRARRDDKGAVSFVAAGKTPTRGNGASGRMETTAVVALALMGSGALDLQVEPLVASLLAGKDQLGTWHSTQATIRSLQALLRYAEGAGRRGLGEVTVLVDGRAAGRVRLEPTTEGFEVVDLPAAASIGRHDVELRFAGTGKLSYQLVSRWYAPRMAQPTGDAIAVTTRVDRATLAVGETVTANVRVESRDGAPLDMLMVTAGVPPGFDPDAEDLERLVKEGVIAKVEQRPREVVFYLTGLGGGKALTLPLRLTSRFPLAVQMPAATAWEYYQPERRGAGSPVVLAVR
jgi:alpha-2-macroglobulin-like protein